MSEQSLSPNASFRAALEAVIDGERLVLARVLSRIRLVLAAIAAATVARLAFVDLLAFLPTIAIAFAYLVTSLVVWRLLKTGKLVKRAGWVVALVDMPLVAMAQLAQTSRLPVPWMGMVNTPTMMVALVALSVLSLSRGVIVATAAVGLVPIFYRGWFTHLHFPPFVLMVSCYGGITAVLLAIVGRMRGLVHTSRAQDLLGKYVLGRKLGVGGMAEVFEATYSPEGGFERRVAIKRILPAFADQKIAMALFRQEAEVGAMLAHPGIVQVLDFGVHQGASFMAMEYIDGVSLKDLVSYQRKLSEPLPLLVVSLIAWQMAEALDYVHTRVNNRGEPLSLVHRDLNPPNIMLTLSGDAKLADFGIALIAGQERMTAFGQMRGKLSYASPEQAIGAPYDRRADLFALGLTLHECLTGNRVFRAKNEIELMRVCREAPIQKPSVFRPEVPAVLDKVVMGLLERDLACRTPWADEMRRQLLEMPRELLDLQQGRKALGALVAVVQDAIAKEPLLDQTDSATWASSTANEQTGTSTVPAPRGDGSESASRREEQ